MGNNNLATASDNLSKNCIDWDEPTKSILSDCIQLMERVVFFLVDIKADRCEKSTASQLRLYFWANVQAPVDRVVAVRIA